MGLSDFKFHFDGFLKGTKNILEHKVYPGDVVQVNITKVEDKTKLKLLYPKAKGVANMVELTGYYVSWNEFRRYNTDVFGKVIYKDS